MAVSRQEKLLGLCCGLAAVAVTVTPEFRTWWLAAPLWVASAVFGGRYLFDTRSRDDEETIHPLAVTTFRKDGDEVLLDIRNDGAAGEFWGRISATGSIKPGMERLKCAWVDNTGEPRLIPKGDFATIQVARLNYDGFLTWRILYFGSAGLLYPVQFYSSHGFGFVGADVDTEVWVEIVVSSKPDMLNGVLTRRVYFNGTTVEDADSGAQISG